MSNGEIILYSSEDGKTRIQLRVMDGTVWLSQAEMAMLFDTTPQNITQHIKSIVEERELQLAATCKDFLQVRNEGGRSIQRTIPLYRLDMILAVGYRVKSHRGTQFRQWATTTLQEYLIKGFVLNDERLKEPDGLDYFDELLERIRDIRSSEKRFYQRVQDLFATSVDYDDKTETAKLFFKTIQNKMLFAVTGQTAAELITERADPNAPNMGLTSWKGAIVRKGDITISKNYLNEDELKRLNLIVSAFLENAQIRAQSRKTTTMQEWKEYVDKVLSLNELNILKNAGNVSHEQMEALVGQHYEVFEQQRKDHALLLSETEHGQDLEAEIKQLTDTREKQPPKKASKSKSKESE